MDKLIRKIKQWLKENGISSAEAETRTGIIVGVSGGADSMCLLLLLRMLAEECGLQLTAVHVHHGIRGREADADAHFVQEMCERLRVSCVIQRRDVPKLAAASHQTLEEAGRQVRYEIFEQLRQERGADWIAVAHHREDQAETVLLNLFRGSGLRGMGGMRPVQGHIIRPLLHVSRQEIEAFLEKNGIDWRQDCTNQETDAARNAVRLNILPEIRAIQPDIIGVLCHSAQRFTAAADYIREEAEQFIEAQKKEQEDGFALPAPALRKLAPALRSEVLYAALAQAAGRKKDLTARHIEQLEQLCEGQSGRRAVLPYGVAAERSYDWLIFHTEGGKRTEAHIPEADMRVVSVAEAEKIAENDCTKRFAYDKIDRLPVWRFRQPGDRIALYADGRGKKLQDFFTDRKIPAAQRERIPVLALDTEILWVAGLRVSAKYRITDETRQVLVVTISDREVLQLDKS